MPLKKSFGQVFLSDKKYIDRIISHLPLDGGIVVEIGPGDGRISAFILPKVKHLYCVEVDYNLAVRLNEKMASPSLTVVNGDILKFDLSAVGEELVVFGNVPFQISSGLIRYLVKHRAAVKKCYMTFQKEFARRLFAADGSKEYGFLTCFFQYHARGKIIFDIPRRAFFPPPRVDASFVEFAFFKEPPFKVMDEKFLFKLLRRVFSARRKKITNALKGIAPPSVIERCIIEAGIPENFRPENISLKDYCRLSNLLFKCLRQKPQK